MPRIAPVYAASPLSHSKPLEGLISLHERGELGKLSVRGEGERFLAVVQNTLGLSLPTEPNTTVQRGHTVVFWLGPDEWLLHLPLEQTEDRATTLRIALAGQHATVVEVSDQSTVLRLSGEYARTVLAKGCPLDLHPRTFRPGFCAQTRFLNAAVLISRVGEISSYDIQVRRSFAEYLWDALTEAAREFEYAC